MSCPRFFMGAAAAAGLWLAPAPALAQGSGQVVAVVVEGPHADEVSGWLEDRVHAPDTLKEGDVFRKALKTRGALPLRVAAGNEAKDAQLIARARAAARETNVDRAILVDLHWGPRSTRVHVWNIDTRHPGAIVDSEVTLPSTATAADETRAILGVSPPAAGAEPAAAPPPSNSAPAPATQPMPSFAPSTEPQADRASPAAPAEATGPLLDAQAGIGIGMRHFSYVDRITPTLRPYDLGAAPLASLTATVYPFGFTHVPVLRDFGFTGDYARAFGITSQDSTGTRVGTTWQSFDVAAIERIPITRALLATVSVGYGGNDFQFDQSSSLAGTPAALPGVAYRFVRAGADLRLSFLSAFTAFGGGSYMDILDTGYTAQLFPRESVGGVEAHLGLSYSLTRSFQASLSAAYTRVFYSVNPVPGDTGVAGGALDEQTRFMAGFSYLM